jgi:hypothetical protein
MATNATIRQVVYDVLRSVRENHPQANVTPAQVAYWTILQADRLRKLFIGEVDSGRFIVTYPSIDALVEATTGRNYCVIPASIYDMNNDDGVAYLSYTAQLDPNDPTFTSVQFTRTTQAESRRLYLSEDERPSPSNPYFYRSAANLYFLGCESLNLTKVEAGLRTNLLAYDTTLDLDTVLDIPQELIPQLRAELVNMGLFITKLPQDYQAEIKENAINIVTKKDI